MLCKSDKPSIIIIIIKENVGGLGFEFCVFVAGWRHALRSEWPFIIIIKENTVWYHVISNKS